MDENGHRARRLSTIDSARRLGSVFVLLGTLGALAALVLPVWQDVVLGQGVAVVPVVDSVLAGWPDAKWFHVAAAVAVALATVGSGYALKVLAIVAETQLVDLGPPRA